MKISSIVILALLLAFIAWRITAFLIERQRQKKADREGVVVYATFVSSEPIKFFGRPQTDVEKVTLRVQEPGSTEAREVVIKYTHATRPAHESRACACPSSSTPRTRSVSTLRPKRPPSARLLQARASSAA